MDFRALVEIISILAMFASVACFIAYRVKLMATVRTHPKPNKNNYSWKEVQESLKRENDTHGSMYNFLKLPEAKLRGFKVAGYTLIAIGFILRVLCVVIK